MFARRVINHGFGRQGKVSKKGRVGEITSVLREIPINGPTAGKRGVRKEISVKGQTKQTVHFVKKPQVKSTRQIAKKRTLAKKDVLPKISPVPEDAEMPEELFDETFDTIYAEQNHKYLKCIESKCCPTRDFLDAGITADNRRVLVAWMREVQEFLKMHQETFHLAVTITDLVVDKGDVELYEYQLLGLVAFFIAAKYLERYVPEVDTLMYLASYAYDAHAIISKEKEVLRVLDYDLNLPTSSWFLDCYTRDETSDKVKQMAALFLDLFNLNAESVVDLPPSIRAASSLMTANELISRQKAAWQQDLEHKSGYSSGCMEPVNRRLKELIAGLYTKKRCSLEEDIVAILSGTSV